MSNLDPLEFLNSPEMREKFHPLAPEIAIKSLFVYVRSCIDCGIDPSKEPAGADIDAVVELGQRADMYSEFEAEFLSSWMKGVLGNEEYRAVIFDAMKPGWQN